MSTVIPTDPQARLPTLLPMARPRKKKPGKSETLGDRIRRYRVEKALTQIELARLLGVNQQFVAYYEVEGVSPAPELLVKIADTLEVSTDELLGRKTRRNPLPTPESIRRWKRLLRLEELPPHDQKAVLKMIDALADRAGKRKAG